MGLIATVWLTVRPFLLQTLTCVTSRINKGLWSLHQLGVGKIAIGQWKKVIDGMPFTNVQEFSLAERDTSIAYRTLLLASSTLAYSTLLLAPSSLAWRKKTFHPLSCYHSSAEKSQRLISFSKLAVKIPIAVNIQISRWLSYHLIRINWNVLGRVWCVPCSSAG